MTGFDGAARRSAFSIWLRTGRMPPRRGADAVEVKFNPWHDPQDGRFTFANTGRHYGGAGGGDDDDRAGRARGPRPGGASGRTASTQDRASTTPPRPATRQQPPGGGWMGGGFTGGGGGSGDGAGASGNWMGGGGDFGGGGASGNWGAEPPPKAARGVMAGGASGNRVVVRPIPIPRPPNPGPNIGRKPAPGIRPQAKPATLRTATPARPETFRTVTRNGYTYRIDERERTRRVSGEITLSTSPVRSRTAQARAGGTDRRPKDDGGHYIAARFNGPTDAFNHFAQDSNFNRGDYRKLENEWAHEKREGKRVTVTIIPRYEGQSMRPAVIDVMFNVDGHQKIFKFPNRRSETRREE